MDHHARPDGLRADPSNPPVPCTPRGTPSTVRYCRECGHPFHARRLDEQYCRAECRRAYHKRRIARALELYDLAYNWRRTRAKGGFADLCQILDEHIRQDRAREKDNKAKYRRTKT